MVDEQLEEHNCKGEVELLDKASRVKHLISSLIVNGKLLCNPLLGGLSLISVPLKFATRDQIPPIFKIWRKGITCGTSGHTVLEETDGSRRKGHLTASNYNLYKCFQFDMFCLPIKRTFEIRHV